MIMSKIEEVQQEIIEEFDMFDDWMGKYEYLIELGKTLPLIDEQYKTENNIIKGCQSRVWLHAEMNTDGHTINYTADSDAILTKGLIGLMVRVLSDKSPEEIAHADMSFIDEIGLKEHLSPTRANGLVSMIKQMKFYAIAMQAN
jgi:cysteine desulfuration protein SufE